MQPPAKNAFNLNQPLASLDLAVRQRLRKPSPVNCFFGRIDRPSSTVCLLPVILVGPASMILGIIDLAMGVQPAKRIPAELSQRRDFTADLIRIIDDDGCIFA